MATVNPYLSFTDNCEEAFNFYKSVFGGEFDGGVMRFGEVPEEFQGEQSEKNKVMHISLPIGKGTYLMGSDTPASMGTIVKGSNYSIAVHPDSEEEATRLFNGLSAGGQVTMPLDKTFWGAYFGMFTDKFGIQWMVNYDYNKKG